MFGFSTILINVHQAHILIIIYYLVYKSLVLFLNRQSSCVQLESFIPPPGLVMAAAIVANSPVLRSLKHYCMLTATTMAWVHVDMMWWNLRSHKPVVVLHLLRTVLLHPIPTELLHPVPSIVCIFMHTLPSITHLSL